MPLAEIRPFLYAALYHGHSVALWRSPDGGYGLVADAEPQASQINDVELSRPGFPVAPFDAAAGPLMRIRPQLLCRCDALSQRWQIESVPADIRATVNSTQIIAGEPLWHSGAELDDSTPSAADFTASVTAAVDAIKTGVFDKVVLARRRPVGLPAGFAAVEAFCRLCIRFPAAFVSLVSLPGYGTWMGATPELLLSRDSAGALRTSALAGTVKHKESAAPSEAAWHEKEIEEQAFVSRYIINSFKSIRLREFVEDGPHAVRCGNLVHLKTDYTIEAGAVTSGLAERLLRLLHPTPAVCGMPRDAALEFIRRREPFSRSLYSGFLGPAGLNNGSSFELYVNLRCMRIVKNTAELFAGVGITSHSQPAGELAETDWKFQAMEGLIGE